uniref:Uncharacterized protein n=1 Tax=Cannabis sativa TaxID=3483 RepID=A0A803QL97_CANSA
MTRRFNLILEYFPSLVANMAIVENNVAGAEANGSQALGSARSASGFVVIVIHDRELADKNDYTLFIHLTANIVTFVLVYVDGIIITALPTQSKLVSMSTSLPSNLNAHRRSQGFVDKWDDDREKD